jgi:hypothetical protein
LTAENLAKEWLLPEISCYMLIDKIFTKEYLKSEFETKSLKEIANWITFVSCVHIQIEEYSHLE